jgi:hypothetical protein
MSGPGPALLQDARRLPARETQSKTPAKPTSSQQLDRLRHQRLQLFNAPLWVGLTTACASASSPEQEDRLPLAVMSAVSPLARLPTALSVNT